MMNEGRSTSESYGSDLLVDWPQRNGSDANITKPRTRITFSEYSHVRSYYNDPTYRKNKSYSSSDLKRFQVEAAREGIRIHQLVTSLDVQSGAAIHKLIGLELLSREELIGIEHLVSGKVAVKVVYERRAHSVLVLNAQEQLRAEKNVRALDTVQLLAKVAMKRSSKNVEKARLRGALAV
ncbi:hypothetical protein HJC23_002649 [Cyclotella cryptica]|uniref:Uncharacterized protein n=1 Tax=Cyclotella cryptica TaxID=29204 RepID=A0ABD3PRP6_9STRA